MSWVAQVVGGEVLGGDVVGGEVVGGEVVVGEVVGGEVDGEELVGGPKIVVEEVGRLVLVVLLVLSYSWWAAPRSGFGRRGCT